MIKQKIKNRENKETQNVGLVIPKAEIWRQLRKIGGDTT